MYQLALGNMDRQGRWIGHRKLNCRKEMSLQHVLRTSLPQAGIPFSQSFFMPKSDYTVQSSKQQNLKTTSLSQAAKNKLG